MPQLLIAVGPKQEKPRKPLSRGGLSAPPMFGNEKSSAPPEGAPGHEYSETPAEEAAEREVIHNDSSAGSPSFSQAQVGYTSGANRCGSCGYFTEPGSCQYVQGTIEAEGSCPLHSALGGGETSAMEAAESEESADVMG